MATRTRTRPALPQNVLFIGNSFTARNDLPGLIAALAAAAGKPFRHQLVQAGGASLRAHWNAGHATRLIESGRFDAVVLQEQSTLPVKNAARMHENVRLFDGVIRAAGAATVLYMTWARRGEPAAQTAITEAYTQIGQELGATVVPVGTAWARFLRTHDSPILHDRDGSHPSRAGTYFAACVFHGALLWESPVGIRAAVDGVGEEDRAALQKAAWEVCRPPTRKARKKG
jgi:hypothetical protein